MKKTIKILEIVLISLAICCGIAYFVCYIFLKEQTKEFTQNVIDLLNKPLPIIGVSTGVVLFFIYKCFVSTKYGKKRINEFKEENDNLRHEIAKYKQTVNLALNNCENSVNELKNDIQETKEYIIEGFELNKNIKIKEIAKKMRGVEDEETIKSDTEKEEI